ncbi:MAG: T9SS type A sorting domain-containing protein [Saprospiraceae bacterium]|nr:T9SS type A sorting domain-containing protein [Saprospiraceae bacterium]
MKLSIFFFANAFLLFCNTLFSQAQHFSTKMDIRVENQEIIADLIALEDYSLLSFQFGFYHNSENVTYKNLYSSVLPDITKLSNSGAACPKYVKIAYYSKNALPFNIKKGDVIFTLVYEEDTPKDHFICMMPSTGSDHCKYMPREVIDKNELLLIVDDVCAHYRIQNGQAILLANEDPDLDEVKCLYNNTLKGFDISSSTLSLDGYSLSVLDLNGKEVFRSNLNTSSSQFISAERLLTGSYLYSIQKSKQASKYGKVIVTE